MRLQPRKTLAQHLAETNHRLDRERPRTVAAIHAVHQAASRAASRRAAAAAKSVAASG